jgi:hypothetical protein
MLDESLQNQLRKYILQGIPCTNYNRYDGNFFLFMFGTSKFPLFLNDITFFVSEMAQEIS